MNEIRQHFYPGNHRHVRDGLQYYLRVMGVISVIGGVIGGAAQAFAVQTDYGFIIWADAIGAGIVSCLLLWGLAAIIDALRVIAANTFRDSDDGATEARAPHSQ